ncbi:nuclear GTPase SLIP-GC-like isoform X2 [Melanotaenia boesemani]|uniref:nuclear GTPase SLIP-GC-like isoform X2 n=1 Tax=Melanotaenia boesemani TaxID=1250792 RepID=UPI001C04A8B4|nr:nuclear GTPase SLIP-GC-like isoform X2 [Melanotaenia boesemani]
MDDFVRDKLTEWGLSNYIEKFQDGKIDEKSLYCLEHEEIKELIPEQGPRSVFKHHLKELKVCRPANDKGKQLKRKSDLQGEGRKERVPSKRQCESLGPAETAIKSKVKRTMESVDARIANQVSIKLKDFLQTKIKDLETDKRELVGVFGRTGAGKSLLINAVIGEDLLPSGEFRACTTVMIKVEASTDGKDEFRAEIEFIKKEDWESEFWALQRRITKNAEDDTKDEDDDIIEKLSAVYGENWRGILVEKPMDSRHFREIPEFLKSENKILTSGSAEGLSEQLVKYTRNDSIQEEDPDVKRAYWPLVKCVTIRVPNNDFLQHVTLVDLPVDRNKSRDEMWRGIVGNCSTVWIVTEIVRAASEKETWEILEEVCSLIGNGGECRHICFICTKSDLLNHRILRVKEELKKEFNKSIKINKHFSGECFDIFTVSSTEYFQGKQSQDNEIPKLQEVLKKLNGCHSETLNYVSGAHGILSLIKGARLRETATVKADVCKKLEENMRCQLTAVKTNVETAYNNFERCLSNGVEQSRSSWDRSLESIFKPKQKGGINFQTLRCIVKNGGIHKTRRGRQINLNMKLASYLLDSIDDEFRKTFPNEGKDGPFYGAINRFTLDTKGLIQGYKEVELHLTFLNTEEEKIKKELNKIILDGKKIIYNSLTKKIEEIMEDCYKRAAEIEGLGTVAKIQQTIESHVKKHMYMFEQAKEAMLTELTGLKMKILEKLEKTMMESIELSLKTDDHSLPDVSDELEAVKKLYDELKGSSAQTLGKAQENDSYDVIDLFGCWL